MLTVQLSNHKKITQMMACFLKYCTFRTFSRTSDETELMREEETTEMVGSKPCVPIACTPTPTTGEWWLEMKTTMAQTKMNGSWIEWVFALYYTEARVHTKSHAEKSPAWELSSDTAPSCQPVTMKPTPVSQHQRLSNNLHHPCIGSCGPANPTASKSS